MKSTAAFLALATAFGFMLCGCGSDGKSDCQLAVDVQNDGMDEACEGRDAECCFCMCCCLPSSRQC